MKKITLTKVERITGKPYTMPKRDVSGNVIFRTDKTDIPEMLETRELVVIIEHFIMYNFPALARDKYTKVDGQRVGNIYRSIKEVSNGVLSIDDEELKWLREKLNDDNIGPKVFLHDLDPIVDALDNFERKHEAKTKDDKPGE